MAPHLTAPPPLEEDLTLPRLLCLHGGGVTASIFEAQARSFMRYLRPSFRLVFADGPFFCDPHHAIIPVYTSHAPFRRWLRWLPEHSDIDAESAVDEISYAIRSAMAADDAKHATGEWVGLVGFSQGAKLAASMLLEQEARIRQAQTTGDDLAPGLLEDAGIRWRFGILMAGRAPLANLCPGQPELLSSKALVSAAEISEGFEFVGEVDEEAVLRTPTVHVHGLADEGLHLHRRLLEQYCAPGTATLLEWDGNHRIPIKSKDVERVVDAIWDVAEKTGVDVTRVPSRLG
ncbi:citrinin biosynthesis oxidoreductase-like protein CtnB [Lophium mytilinum]|uniref:Citrinin biosynthesis oxidoreductase-like protein CtnB n=1 Tax=Lophium mytilinum TaxID=390894 RepID=A0A6A6R520_9PEZI|nr:citrinin biosynthesis oxidoreductase-like protein CtnB [Lophium mytilinum]